MPVDAKHGYLGALHAWIGQDCLLCGSGSGTQFLCPDCEAALPALGSRCPRCALPGLFAAPCGACLAAPPHFDATTALWRYEFPCDRLIQSLKYQGRIAVARCLARSLASIPLPRVDRMVPVPLHPRRLRERGFNQSLEIARYLSSYTGTPCEAFGARRRRDTAPQTGLPLKERATNARGAFACEVDLSGETVAILDDVMTTGATVNELAGTLKKAGAARVEVIVVARTPAPDA